MDFCDGDAPWGDVGKVHDVLEFLTHVATRPSSDAWSDLGSKERDGLCWILAACTATLESARARGEK